MPGTTCLLLWGGACKGSDACKVLDRFGSFEQGGGIMPATTMPQPLHILALEAALLAGHKIDEDSDDFTLAKKNLRVPLWPEENGQKLSKAEKKKKRAIDRELCKNLEISGYPCQRQEKFMEELLGKELASRSTIRIGFDKHAKEGECEDPLPLFLYFSSSSKVKTAYCNSYQRNDMCQMDWEQVPNIVDRWAFFKASRLLGLAMDEKPSLLLTMYVPPHKSQFAGEEEYDY